MLRDCPNCSLHGPSSVDVVPVQWAWSHLSGHGLMGLLAAGEVQSLRPWLWLPDHDARQQRPQCVDCASQSVAQGSGNASTAGLRSHHNHLLADGQKASCVKPFLICTESPFGIVFKYFPSVKKLFYWNIVELQCCGNFCYTAKFIHVYIYTFFFTFLSIMVYPRMVSTVPCPIQKDLVVYIFAWVSIGFWKELSTFTTLLT